MELKRIYGGMGDWYETPDGRIGYQFGENVCYSDDDGRTFGPPQKFFPGGGMCLLRLQSGRLCMSVYNPQWPAVKEAKLGGASTMDMLFSDDEGKTWGDRVRVTSRQDAYYLHNDRTMQLSTGRILVPLAMVPREKFGVAIETSDVAGCYYSDDNGKTWKESNWVAANDPSDHLAEPICVELPNGDVKMFARSTTGYIREMVSKDGGATWGPEKATTLRLPCSPFSIRRDPYSGYYFALHNNSFPGPRYQYTRCPLTLSVSRDGTETWEFVCEVENDPNSSYGYPCFFFSEEAITFTYYERKNGRGYKYDEHRQKLRRYERSELTVRVTHKNPLV